MIRKKYFYICEDCGEVISQRLDVIKNMKNMRCRRCSSKKSAKIMSEKRDSSYIKKFIESRQNNLIEKNSLYYGLYNLGYSDKNISNILNKSSSCISSWRIRRGIPPNLVDKENRNPDGTWIKKSIVGSRDIYLECRDSLYKWKNRILKRDRFKCQLCGNKNKLEVHHNGEDFASIINKFSDSYRNKDISYRDRKLIANKVTKYHYDNNVSGITLCKECHIWVHNINPLDMQ